MTRHKVRKYHGTAPISRSAAHKHHLEHVENSMALKQYNERAHRGAKA